jgi:hypothetical protein
VNYGRVKLCFLISIPADIAMVFAGVPELIMLVMNIALYFVLVPFPVSRQELRDIFRK